MARIRTVKPEFWTHHIMGRATDSQKCMALALLNHADDEGYFLADPAIVRSVCRPFDEESLTSHGLITDLSLLGWIELCKSDDGVMLGRIVKFKQNQIINRPKKSKLKESWSDHGLVTDESLTHHVGKGKEGNREREINTTSSSKRDQELISAFNDNRQRLVVLFPSIDLDIAFEKMLATDSKSYAKKHLNPYEAIIKWMQMEFKPKAQAATSNAIGGRQSTFDAIDRVMEAVGGA